jgi:hypothetical protein
MDKTRIDNTMDKGRRIRQYNEQRKKDQTIQWTKEEEQTIQWTTEEGSDNTKDKRRRTDNTMDKGRKTDNTKDKRRRNRRIVCLSSFVHCIIWSFFCPLY